MVTTQSGVSVSVNWYTSVDVSVLICYSVKGLLLNKNINIKLYYN